MFPWKYVIGACLALLTVVWVAAEIKHAGRMAERERIERENDDAGDNADRARGDYDECIANGGVFNFATRKCRRP